MNETAAVAVGAKVSVKTPKSWPTTSTVTYASDNTEIATVDATTGEVTGVKAGEANITATLVCGEKTVVNSTKVTVKNVVLESVKQTRRDTVEAKVVGNTKNLKNEDILITCKNTNVVYRVKSVVVDSNDPTKVIISTYGSMTDSMLYTVKIDDIEKEFTATDNVVANVSVSPLQIAAGDVGTEIVGQTVDKNGVILDEATLMSPVSNVDFNIKVNATDGYTRESQLVLYKAGNKATAEITYHTYKYENGSEVGVITKTFDIVAVDTVVTTSEFNYTILKTAGATPDWKAVKTQVPVGDLDMYAQFRFVDSNNNDVTEKYTVETSDRTTLMVADGDLAAKANTPVHVVGLKEGSAYINVKDANGNIIKSLPVTVVAARKLARVQLGSSNLVVANNDLTSDALKAAPGYVPVTEVTVSVDGFDQYGDRIAVITEASAINNASAALVTTTTSGSIVVDGTQGANGTHQYRLTISDGKGTQQLYSFAVRVVTPTPTGTVALENVSKRRRENYRLVVTPRSYDVAVTAATTKEKKDDTIDVKIGVYENGALIAYLPIVEATWNGAKDSNVTTSGALNTEKALFENTTFLGDAYKSISTGTYRVKAFANLDLDGDGNTTDNGEKVEFYDDITVTDSTNGEGAVITKWVISRFTTSISNLNKDSIDPDKVQAAKDAIEQCLNVSCFGVPVNSGNFLVDANDVIVTNNAIFIKKAYVKQSIGGVNYAVPFTINLTFTVQ